MFAAVRFVASEYPGTAELFMLAPDGKVLWKQPMALPPINGTLAWSPDGRLLAYRQDTQNFTYGPTGDDEEGKLVIVDTQTGIPGTS
jgi:hypothetical protein